MLRDLEFCCFVNHEETHVPEYIIKSCMMPDDVQAVAAVLKILCDYLK